MTLAKTSVTGLFAILSLFGQAGQTSPQPSFVASIKPSRDTEPTGFKITRGRLLARGVTAKYLIAIAYGLQKFQIVGGERWVDSERFDVEAKLDEQAAGSENERSMIKHLLADRFKLKAHRETQESPIYALIVASNGPKLKAASTQGRVNVGVGALVSTGMPLSLFASLLGTRLDRSVVDRTKLEGLYAIDLRWTPEAGEPTSGVGVTSPTLDLSGPSIFTALQEQLGLKLLATKGPPGFLIIDRVEKPSFE